jgi:hypothetical protein
VRLSGSQRLQLLGDFALGSVKCSKEDATAAVEIVGNNGTTLEFEVQRRFHQFGRHFEQLFGEGNEFFDRKTAMPFIHRLGERVGDPGTYPDQRCLLDAELGRDLISRSEADAADVASQPIRVLRDQPDGVDAVSLVDAHRARGADTVAVQEQHSSLAARQAFAAAFWMLDGYGAAVRDRCRLRLSSGRLFTDRRGLLRQAERSQLQQLARGRRDG